MVSDGPAEKKARTDEPESYYKVIDGVKYDRALLHRAEEFAKDGQISAAEAKLLFDDAQDGRGVTDVERATLEYTMKTMNYTDKAATYLATVLGGAKVQGYYKQVNGVRYDRGLLEKADCYLATGGVISLDEAKDLWEDAQDGRGVTQTEKATLEYTLATHKYTVRASEFMKSCLGLGKTPSYYKQIDGVKYDREILEKAEGFSATGGVISHAEAKELWEDAQDGKGVTPCEKRTLEYTLVHFKYTDKAATFMRPLCAAGKAVSYYKVVEGVRYDRELLDLAEAATTTAGVVSDAEAQGLWEAAQDGKGVTKCERQTLEHILKTTKFTDKAEAFLRGKLA